MCVCVYAYTALCILGITVHSGLFKFRFCGNQGLYDLCSSPVTGYLRSKFNSLPLAETSLPRMHYYWKDTACEAMTAPLNPAKLTGCYLTTSKLHSNRTQIALMKHLLVRTLYLSRLPSFLLIPQSSKSFWFLCAIYSSFFDLIFSGTRGPSSSSTYRR